MPLRIRNRSRPGTPGYFKAATEGTGLIDWAPIAERFAAAHNYWVGTASASGRPHAMPVWGVWLGDRFAFSTSPLSRKARNLRANPRIAVHLEDGNAVIVIEGRARELRAASELSAFLVAYNPKYRWNFTPEQVAEGVFEVTPEIAFAWLGGEGDAFGGTATRWRFETPATADATGARAKRPRRAVTPAEPNVAHAERGAGKRGNTHKRKAGKIERSTRTRANAARRTKNKTKGT